MTEDFSGSYLRNFKSKRMVSKKVTATVLSISLLTVMAGAAIAPALGIIREHFASESELLIKFIVSIPALFIILTTLCFSAICKCLRTRTIAIVGLSLYVLSGCGAFFFDDIVTILCLRALLGVSVGLIMPLSTGLLSFYYPPEEQAKLMGLSAAMNQMGGVVATLLAGILANIVWNYAFWVYGLGLIALILVVLFLPNEKLLAETSKISISTLIKFHPSVTGMFLLMTLFFIYPTNFAITSKLATNLSTNTVTLIMVGLDLIAFFVGLSFGFCMHIFRRSLKYFAPLFFLGGYAIMSICITPISLIVASILIGVGNGVGVPYLNTIASIKGGRVSATTVMPLLSASLYLGQFVSPLLISSLSELCFGSEDMYSPYKIGVAIGIVFFFQAFSTRNFQSLPPEDKKKTAYLD